MLPSPLSTRLSFHARHALKEARDIARYTKSPAIESRHLLLALALEEGSLSSILLSNIGFSKEILGKHCLKKSPLPRTKETPPKKLNSLIPLSSEIQNVIRRSFYLAREHAYPYVGTEHLMSALLETPDTFLDNLIETLEIDTDKIDTIIESHLHFEQFPQMARLFDVSDFSSSDNGTGSSTPFLDQFTIDLAQEARQHDLQLVGREPELERLMQILGRKEKRNAILLGDPGVGKTALVTALAQKIESGNAGPLLSGKRILGLDLALLVAGTSFRGEFESRIKELLKEIQGNRDIILFIDEIHAIVGTGNTQGGLDAANILKPALARGAIQCIGATTLAEYKKHLEKDAALERRFQTILVQEPSIDETLALLTKAKAAYEKHHEVRFPDETLVAATKLSVRHLPDRFLPDKALDLIDEAGALVHRQGEQGLSRSQKRHTLESRLRDLEREKSLLIEKEEYDRAAELQKKFHQLEQEIDTEAQSLPQSNQSFPIVTPRDILIVLAQMTHIPLERLAHHAPREQLTRLGKALREEVIGQETVHSAVKKLLTRSLSPVTDPKRPLGSLLLLGPTGVGKTHLAQVLATHFFGDEQALIRLDMSEFMERHSVAQILGAPAGYVGYGEGGKLTEAVRRRPYSLILFDEIEKAHPDVANILLQILDEGFLTDAEGRKVSFKNTLILLTSNVGTASILNQSLIGFKGHAPTSLTNTSFETLEHTVREETKTAFRPELLARLDQVLVFQPLSLKHLTAIATLELQRLTKRLAEHGITLKIQDRIAPLIATDALTRQQGARPIRQYIAEHIESVIAEKLLTKHPPTRLTLTESHGHIIIR